MAAVMGEVIVEVMVASQALLIGSAAPLCTGLSAYAQPTIGRLTRRLMPNHARSAVVRHWSQPTGGPFGRPMALP
jgi:hypothetical protein